MSLRCRLTLGQVVLLDIELLTVDAEPVEEAVDEAPAQLAGGAGTVVAPEPDEDPDWVPPAPTLGFR